MKKLNSVLLVDDNDNDIILARRIFVKTGICSESDIFDARDGKEALDFLFEYEENRKKYSNKYPPILVLLDINMPIMSGFEFLENVQPLITTDKYGPTIVTMVTSSINPRDIAKAKAFQSIKKYIQKPLTREDALKIYDEFFVT